MRVRTVFSSGALALAIAASGCAAGSGRDLPTYTGELDRLADECRQRGGILVPIPGAATGRPQTDHACRITGGASRLD